MMIEHHLYRSLADLWCKPLALAPRDRELSYRVVHGSYAGTGSLDIRQRIYSRMFKLLCVGVVSIRRSNRHLLA